MTDDTEAIVAALDRLTTAVQSFFVPMVDEPVPVLDEQGCSHPEDRRKSFATSQDDDFFCLDCQTMIARPRALKG